MNKKAIEDDEALQYKIKKEEPIGSSHMVSGFFIFLLAVIILTLIVIFIYSNISKQETLDTSNIFTMLKLLV